jgi:L-amino acid N-acyltransferase YncA
VGIAALGAGRIGEDVARREGLSRKHGLELAGPALTGGMGAKYDAAMSAFKVRDARVADLDAIMEIWRAGIQNSLGGPLPETMDYPAYFKARLEEQTEVFKFFIVESPDGKVIAWQSLLPFRSNPATRGTMGEISAYTHPAHIGGRATIAGLTELFAHADRSPLHFVLAFIANPNHAASSLARHFGMQEAITLPPTPKAAHLPPLGLFIYTCGQAH